MATYLKRTSKLFDISLIRPSAEVNLRDLICPVCRGILIEPVTLPCNHNLCLRCLKGTFEHNSLSCPLCRVRVGSWLRTATKSETLVNGALWELIRARFPKEIEGKRNGNEGDIELDSGFTSKKVILSAAGEIRREYEVQLQIAEDEMRRQRESERLANEALIRKIHAEEHKEKLSQLANDESLAKSLAKKQLSGGEKIATVYRSEYESKNSYDKIEIVDEGRATNFNVNPTNLQCASLRIDAMNGEKNPSNDERMKKFNKTIFCQKSISTAHNIVTRTLKHQAIGKYASSTNFSAEPSCSGTQIYGTRSNEELHVPIDILSKKKRLGVEICVTQAENDERIGSAESAGSHDSINQEIHHFKPIKPIARTSLKISHDGRPIDPKLIRVIPILKRVSNAVPKPPSPTHLKRILGCSWSAFRGKARKNLELRLDSPSPSAGRENNLKSRGGALRQSQGSSCGKILKTQPSSDTARRLDLATDASFDADKNYSKGIGRMLNGARVCKKLSLDADTSMGKSDIAATARNSKIRKIRENRKIIDAGDKKKSSNGNDAASIDFLASENSCNCDVTIENIAERIKRRKIREITIKSAGEGLNEGELRKTRGNTRLKNSIDDDTSNFSKNSKIQKRKEITNRTMVKRRKIIDDDSRVGKRILPTVNSNDRANSRSSVGADEKINFEKTEIMKNTKCEIDRRIIEEQTRMERLIDQEKNDFELAVRLQAQFDDMERIAGRTRGSRRAMEDNAGTNNFFERSVESFDNEKRDNAGNTSRECKNIEKRRKPQKRAVK